MNFPSLPFSIPDKLFLVSFILFLYCLSPWQINVFVKKQYNLNFTYLFNLTSSLQFFLIMNYINEKSVFSCFEFRFTLRECRRKFFLHSPVFVISFVILTSISVIQNMQHLYEIFSGRNSLIASRR